MDVDMVYYDHEHTGSSDDIYHAKLEGKFYKVKSSICEEVKEWQLEGIAAAKVKGKYTGRKPTALAEQKRQ